MTIPEAIRRAARERAELATRLRRELHRIPELALQELETTRFVEGFLAERGISFERAAVGTGGVAVLGRGEPSVFLRADLDALPVAEETGLPFGSVHPGRMHACGHDAHAAMLLAVADALAAGSIPLPGRVVCVFQPAEEGPGGCRRLLEEGLLERFPARFAAALHVWPGLSTGAVGLSPGPVMASMDRLRLAFHGRGGHGAHPHACIDPVVMAAEGVLALQTVVSRRIDPLEPALLTLGAIHGGTASNVIPDRVDLLGTVRAYSAEVRELLLAGIRQVGEGIAAAHGGRFSCIVDEGYPVTRNDPEGSRKLSEGLRAVLGEEALVPSARTMGAEDMGFLLERVPGCYLQLGASADPARAEPLHSPRFDLDEECLAVGICALLTAAWVGLNA
ncbi:MAG: M20 family metallopeptidase [Deferrisomatales bacterium]|nr:M20 family metallopeptidase [Deferrisomatales bacterium]